MFDFGLNFLFHFLILSYQRIVLNGQISSWKNILAKVHQGSALFKIKLLIDDRIKPLKIFEETPMLMFASIAEFQMLL